MATDERQQQSLCTNYNIRQAITRKADNKVLKFELHIQRNENSLKQCQDSNATATKESLAN
ncbi:hypothetical protein MY4038_009374 [Beauveria bassiana]